MLICIVCSSPIVKWHNVVRILRNQKLKYKLGLSLCIGLLLGACSTTTEGLRQSDLRQATYLVGEYKIAANFPEIQKALFQHQAACGKAAVFRMDERQASYGTLRYARNEDGGWENTILFELTQLASGSTVVQAYSYRPGGLTQVQEVLASIRAPGVCEHDAEPESKKE